MIRETQWEAVEREGSVGEQWEDEAQWEAVVKESQWESNGKRDSVGGQ